VTRPVLALQVMSVAAAAALLAFPLPSSLVEQHYADGLYPTLQATLTRFSNATAFSLFDVLLATAVVLLVTFWGRAVLVARRRRAMWPLLHAGGITLVAASTAYLWFALAWGLNYSRAPLASTIGYDAQRVTRAAVTALADRAVGELNRRHAAAHRAGFPEVYDPPVALVAALHEIEARLGRPRATVPGRPKRTLLALFFRASGVDGMHAPFLLETLINPDLTPPERPAVIAHEWAHMAGYAPEADASFVGLLATLRADEPARYSGWLMLFDEAVSQLPAGDRRRMVERLAPGPQADRRAIAQRISARVPAVARASWETYDRYLKAQGVDEGVRSYSQVVQLLVGSGALDWQE
jgi:hypothetical protein